MGVNLPCAFIIAFLDSGVDSNSESFDMSIFDTVRLNAGSRIGMIVWYLNDTGLLPELKESLHVFWVFGDVAILILDLEHDDVTALSALVLLDDSGHSLDVFGGVLHIDRVCGTQGDTLVFKQPPWMATSIPFPAHVRAWSNEHPHFLLLGDLQEERQILVFGLEVILVDGQLVATKEIGEPCVTCGSSGRCRRSGSCSPLP